VPDLVLHPRADAGLTIEDMIKCPTCGAEPTDEHFKTHPKCAKEAISLGYRALRSKRKTVTRAGGRPPKKKAVHRVMDEIKNSAERMGAIKAFLESGRTLEEIGQMLGISKQYVKVIMSRQHDAPDRPISAGRPVQMVKCPECGVEMTKTAMGKHKH
jgi:endogenous inhibitor of DNA gyrase (YacG/DUF329 family)